MAKKVLSQAEKREVYVREGWVGAYNLARLMAWHDNQDIAEQPDGFMWHKLFRASDFGLRQQIQNEMSKHGPAGMILDDIAQSCSARSTQVIPFLKALGNPLQWFVDHLDWVFVKVVPIESSRLALVGIKPPHETCVLHLDDEDKTVEFAELSESDLFDAALDAWEDRAPEREQARRWLCLQLWSAILRLREQAAVEFDTSVAISDDGMRILGADYVVVYAWEGKVLKFHCHQRVAFLMQKNRLGQPHVIRRPAPKRQQTEEKVLQSVLKPGEVKKVVMETRKLKRTQTLLQVGKLRILFISADQILADLKPGVRATDPAPTALPTQPSPGDATAPASSSPPVLLQGAPFDPGDD